uniref:Uncharacterized protein n=1 Tax=Rhodnius prolixus TaxID=13249 RepID=T1I490_RHOPR
MSGNNQRMSALGCTLDVAKSQNSNLHYHINLER